MIAELQSTSPANVTPAKKRKIPAYLVKETIDGIPFYYAGFRSVLHRNKTKTDIMADSGLQGYIKSMLMRLLLTKLDPKQYIVMAGEIGSHLDHRNNLALDLTIYDRQFLTAKKINTRYVDVAPKVVIEVDVRVEIEDRSTDLFDEFVLRKVRKLHEFGTEKIIWIFTKSKTIIVATPGNSWGIFNLNDDVEVMDGISFNLGKYLESEGIGMGDF
jgi:hypothetical protein